MSGHEDGTIKTAIVDEADYRRLHLLATHKWSISKDGYARCTVQRKLSAEEWEARGTTRPRTVETVWMHRYIMGLTVGDPREVDHQNGDPLDNTRRNLYVVTRVENVKNIRRKSKAMLKQWRKDNHGKVLTLEGTLADEEAVKLVTRPFRKRV